MKKIIKISVFAIFILAFLVAPSICLFAQGVDSTAAASPEIVDSVFGITIPGFVKIILLAAVVMLTGVQFILKRIPTDVSVKIGGVLGKILDVLTFFQKDKTAR